MVEAGRGCRATAVCSALARGAASDVEPKMFSGAAERP